MPRGAAEKCVWQVYGRCMAGVWQVYGMAEVLAATQAEVPRLLLGSDSFAKEWIRSGAEVC